MSVNFQKVAFELAAGREEQLPFSTVPEIVFSGRSNVGKSSLLNKLVNRKSLARVSATPGKTATINFYRLENCRFVDLPGYGYARVSKSEKQRWASLVEGYFAQNRKISLVIQLIDMRHDPTADDKEMIQFLLDTGYPFALVCTKSDKLNKTETSAQMDLFHSIFSEAGIRFFPFSAVTGEGTETLRSFIECSLSPTVEAVDFGKDG